MPDADYTRPMIPDTQPYLSNEQRRQRGEVESAGAAHAALRTDDFQSLAAARAAIARIAPDADQDFRDLLLMDFGFFAGYEHGKKWCLPAE